MKRTDNASRQATREPCAVCRRTRRVLVYCALMALLLMYLLWRP